MFLDQLEPLETLSRKLRFGVDYINIIVMNSAMSTHIASYDFKTGKFVDFHTQKEINEPVMWCELPRFSEGVFEALCDELAYNKRHSDLP